MKEALSILALVASVSFGYSQGTVNFTEFDSRYAVSTNSNFGGFGPTSTVANSYYYALLIQPYTEGSPVPTSNPFDPSWSFSGAMATNNTSFAGGINGGIQAIAGWTPGATMYVEVVGWSANMATTFQQFEVMVESGDLNYGDYFGYSVVGRVVSGGLIVGGAPPGPANPLFGSTAISSGFVLTSPIPEPTTIALIGLGGLGLAMIRRRK
jgi:hypothetical protein